MSQRQEPAKEPGKRSWPTRRGGERPERNTTSQNNTLRRFSKLFCSLFQLVAEAGWEVEGHLEDRRWRHPERVSQAGHGAEEGHAAHQRPLQDRPERQPPLAGACAAAHSRPVSITHWSATAKILHSCHHLLILITMWCCFFPWNRAVWYDQSSYPTSWQLDPTEGPNRERRRLQRCYLTIPNKYLLKDRHKLDGELQALWLEKALQTSIQHFLFSRLSTVHFHDAVYLLKA